MKRVRRFRRRFLIGGLVTLLVAAQPLGMAAAMTVWPGSTDVTEVDAADTFGGNLSGLAYQGTGTQTPGVLWGARNGPGALYRLLWDGTAWIPDSSNGWSSGKALRFPNGTGDVDAEGVTFDTTDSTFMYVSSERDNDNNGTSRNSVLRFDTNAAGASLSATHEWDLTSDLPATAPNGGIEAITWVPDSFLVSSGFIDQTAAGIYDPAAYPNHGDGLFFVGLEETGGIFAFALDHVSGAPTLVSGFASGLARIMGLEFDAELGDLWAACDGNCDGEMTTLEVDGSGAFVVTATHSRPAMMPNLNNEGIAISPLAECVGGARPMTWVDDNETDGHALRQGTLDCPVVQQFCDGQVVTVDIGAGETPTPGPDVILGTPGPDHINGLGGNDLICGSGGNDVLEGGSGEDTLFGDEGDDSLHGGADNDVIFGGIGSDTVLGYGGDDQLNGGDQDDYLWGGPGSDTYHGDDGSDTLDGFSISAVEIETMFGDAGDDVIFGSIGNDQLHGGAGEDFLSGGGGVDSLFGDGDVIDICVGTLGSVFDQSCEAALP